MPSVFTFTWNLKNKRNEQPNRNLLINTENSLAAARGVGGGGLSEKGEGIHKYKLAITK